MWNYREVGAPGAGLRKVSVSFAHTEAQTAQIQTLDGEHGNFATAYLRMGAPRYPTRQQLDELQTSATATAPVSSTDGQQRLSPDIPPTLVLVTGVARPIEARRQSPQREPRSVRSHCRQRPAPGLLHL